MASIAYQNVLCQTQSPEPSATGPVEPEDTLVRAFYPKAKQMIVTGDYLRRKWQPLCGPRFYALIKAIRGYCSYSIKEGEALCYPSEETLARACGVTRRTIINWLVRVRPGEEEKFPGKKVGDFCHQRHGDALQQFLRIVPQLRYDRVGQRSVKAVHHYFVRMDDPPIPEDIPLIWAKARELAITHLEAQAKARDQEARRQEIEARAAWSASSSPEDCTYNNGKNMRPQQWEKCAQDRLSSPSPITPDFHRSAPGEELRSPAIGNTKGAVNRPVNKEGDEENKASTASQSISTSATAQRSENQFRRAAPLDEAAERQRAEREQALSLAYEAAGGVITSLLEELGDTNTAGGTRKVLSSLVAAGVPAERMANLAYLARDRVRAFILRGGRILDTQVGFYITTLCNLAKEAQRKEWNLEQMAAADRRRHERAIRLGAQCRAAQMTPQEAAQRPERWTARKPTPTEAEALVLELGQQEATYAEAQAQVRQVKEHRQAREARQQAIQQQAQLFSRLAQAEQALTMHPEGSLAWERTQREKQELEQQIAALRQPGGVSSTAPAAPPETIPHPLTQDRNEQEYREAIHAWARARGWTVKHRVYGGSQRDWQIGLMGVRKAELRALAAELGI